MPRVYRKGRGTSRQVKITEAVIARVRPPMRDGRPGRLVLRDTVLPGFGVAVAASGAARYLVLGRVAGRKVNYRLPGRPGVVKVEAARKQARTLLGQMAAGARPGRPEGGITLREAVQLALGTARTNNRSPRTLQAFGRPLERYLGRWMDRPLATITREEANRRHQALAAEVAAGKSVLTRKAKGRGRRHVSRDGRATANATFRTFRGVYNRALRQHPELPANPCGNVDWFRLKTERTAIPEAVLPEWYKRVQGVENPVRRDYLLFTLFSGMRRTAVAEMRWADVDLKRRALRVPRPKGGEKRAFDLPLSDALVELLERRRAEHAEIVAEDKLLDPWVWPAASKTGHIAEPREDGLGYGIH
ncbi:MAG: site-specific integrase, partial [Gemmatimonadales bacterium]